MWARYVPNADIGPGNDGKLYWTDAVNSEDVWEFLAQANANALGGYTIMVQKRDFLSLRRFITQAALSLLKK